MKSQMRSWWTMGAVVALLAVAATVGTAPAQGKPQKKPAPVKSLEFALFEPLLDKYRDMTYEQLQTKLGSRQYLHKLSFDPTQAAHFDRVKTKLEMTKQELDLFKSNGFVSVDLNRRHTFASAYFQIYSQDMPVLVTSDSIMHALHRSYDEVLMELETTLFTWSIEQVLAECHKQLGVWAAEHKDDGLSANLRDVDLYLTVARNLLAGAGAPAKDDGKTNRNDEPDVWNGQLAVKGHCGTSDEALARLKDIQSLKIQVPLQDQPTQIYGGERFVDYSQFKPRGHYTKALALKRYFRTMMWLGRADTAWNILPPAPGSFVNVDSARELKDS